MPEPVYTIRITNAAGQLRWGCLLSHGIIDQAVWMPSDMAPRQHMTAAQIGRFVDLHIHNCYRYGVPIPIYRIKRQPRQR